MPPPRPHRPPRHHLTHDPPSNFGPLPSTQTSTVSSPQTTLNASSPQTTVNASTPSTPATHVVGDTEYDVKVLGLEDGTFYAIHVTAMVSIVISFTFVLFVIVSSFRKNSLRYRAFHSWTTSERCVIYAAICDGSFNLVHFIDHTQMISTVDHVRPLALCQFYAFIMLQTIFAKNILVITLSFDAYLLIRHRKVLDFGDKDWKIVSLVFGVPIPVLVVICIFGELGPAGAFCSFRIGLVNLLMSIIPFTAVLFLNSAVYGATLYFIRDNAKRIEVVIGKQAQSSKGYLKAAKTMSLFMLAYILQWSPVCIYSIWQLVGEPHMGLYFMVVTFTNFGGVFNGGIFFFINRNRRRTMPSSSEEYQMQQTNITNGNQIVTSKEGSSTVVNSSELSSKDDKFPKVSLISMENCITELQYNTKDTSKGATRSSSSSNQIDRIGINIRIETHNAAITSDFVIHT